MIEAGTTAPTARDFLSRHRGGGLFTEAVSQRLGAVMALAAYRRGVAPTVLSLANLALGLAAAALVIAVHDRAPLVVGLAAGVLWHLAYGLDCADGQLARVTGRASPAGKRIDILCDVALQIALVAAVATVASRSADPPPPAWLVAGFAGTWMVNLVTSLLQHGEAGASLVVSTSLPVRLAKLSRDYGAVLTVVVLVVAFVPAATTWLLAAFTVINGLFLLVSITMTARAALRG